MAALASLSDVKAYARITANTDDALLNRLIAAVSDLAEKHCSRRFAVTTYTDAFRPIGQSSIFLRYAPIVSFTQLLINGVEITTDRFTRDGRVVALNSGPFGGGPVVATYTAGFDPVPDAVQQAVIETVVLRYKELPRLGEASKSMGGETVSYITAALTPSAKAMLAPYIAVAL